MLTGHETEFGVGESGLAPTEATAVSADAWVAQTLSEAIDGAPGGAVPLFLANRDLAQPEDPVARLWQLSTTLREHRGDGHVAAWTAEGFAPVDGGGVTERGAAVVADVEQTTDRLAGAPFTALTADEGHRLIRALSPLAGAVAAAELIPTTNPIGLPVLSNEEDR